MVLLDTNACYYFQQHFYWNSTGKCIVSDDDITICNPFVYIKPKLDTAKDESDLMDFAINNMRYFQLTNSFNDDLLLKSPRELGDNKELKKQIYNLGKPVDTSGVINGLRKNFLFGIDRRIDYFISHSWDDSTETKKRKSYALKNFADEFKKKHGRFPRVWFDKVCINQENPGLGVSVLPINVVFCKKLLIVATGTYLKRLW